MNLRFLLRQACLWAGLLSLLSGCQTPPHTTLLLAQPPAIATQHFIRHVPFYPQQTYYCGPTTLSEVAGFYGLNKDPATIAPVTFIPGLQGTLQIEMQAATRQLGMVAYAQRGTLRQLLSLVAEDIPVIVLQNNAIAWYPQWHYAVVIGYDLQSQEVILHTGVTEAHRLNFATFERTWARGNYWLLAMLPADQSSPQLEPFIYVKASQDLIATQQVERGILALTTATRQWPDYWLPYFLLGNHFFSTQPQVAAEWFEQGLPFARQEISYLNNYAVLLSQQGCQAKAIKLIEEALSIAPHDSQLLDSQKLIGGANDLDSGSIAQCALSTVNELR